MPDQAERLKDMRLAELHARARELGLERYRMLTRSELIEAIGAASRGGPSGGPSAKADAPSGEPSEPKPPRDRDRAEDGAPARGKRRRRRRGGRGRGRGRAEDGGEGRERERPERAEKGGKPDDGRGAEELDLEQVETEEVTGVLDRMPQGYGFLRLQGLHPADGDVYVSASQIKRCELRPGDEVSGPAREPRRGERHRALVRVGSVNGIEPESERVQFEDLTPVAPHRRVPLQGPDRDPLVRAVDLLGPLALGQRVLVLAEPRSGRTTLLRVIGAALAGEGARVVALLADERPEEVTGWERALPEAEIVAAPADTEPRDQVRAAELALGHAQRRAEAGEDVVVLIDSLSRLALGYRDPARVKRLFGAGRELAEEGAGSLTIVATVLDTDEEGERARASLLTTENLLLRLDAGLASAGIVPALIPAECRASGEEELRSPEELEKIRKLRAELTRMEPEEAARALSEQIVATSSNEELLARL